MTTTDLKELPPLANIIIDRTIDSVNRKLIGGFRNKKNSRPNAKTPDIKSTVKDSLSSASASSVQEVANRGIAWKEMITKSLTRGISSLSSMQFDGEFTVTNGVAEGLNQVPNTLGVYVVYNKENEPVYIGDSTKLQSRWYAGHLNEHKQKKNADDSYKLATEFEEGCTVRYIKMESEETAAALEAHLILTEKPLVNSKEELSNEQGKRSNIEAKKIKDSFDNTSGLIKGAALEAAKNSGFVVLEALSAAILKALKDELVDIFGGGKAQLSARIKRFFEKIWSVLLQIIKSPLKLLEGIFEFIVNALSKAISEIYMLARNLLELSNTAWQLFNGAKNMSTEEWIQKVSETIIISGTLVVWDALDPVIEAQLLPFVGPVAPYLAAAISAIGFGLSSHYLQGIVPTLVEFLVNTRNGHQEAVEAQRAACVQLITVSERNFELVDILGELARSSRDLIVEMRQQTEQLSSQGRRGGKSRERKN